MYVRTSNTATLRRVHAFSMHIIRKHSSLYIDYRLSL